MFLTEVLENKKITGPTIAVLSFLVLFLWVWKSGVESKPHARHQIEEEDVVKPKVKEVKSIPEDSLDSYSTDKRVYEFTHISTKYRRSCRAQVTPTSSCTRLSCDDGKVYCVASYLELTN